MIHSASLTPVTWKILPAAATSKTVVRVGIGNPDAVFCFACVK
jgi:hypothetical protein